MDSGESSLVSGDLTSTMENVLVTNDQDNNSDKNESTSAGDSVPSSSSDANVQATVLKAVLDDPISSTSDTINSVSEMNLKNACDVSLEISVESEGGASELVTDSDFFSSELNIGSICTEKISEDVEDIANDLENLLGESSHEYSVSSNTDKSFDLESFESQSNKNVFEEVTQTKDITTSGTSENVQLIEVASLPEDQETPDDHKLESVDKTQIDESLFTDGVVDTNEGSKNFESLIGTSESTNQTSELESYSISASITENVEYSNEFSEPDIRCSAEYTQFVIQEEIIDTKSDIRKTTAEDDQSDDEEVYGMVLQIRDDNQDSTTGDEARTEEDSQESMPQCEWSEKILNSGEVQTSKVDLPGTDTDVGKGQIVTDFQNQQIVENASSSLEIHKASSDDGELKMKEQLSEVEIITEDGADTQPDTLVSNTSDIVEESIITVEHKENNTDQKLDVSKLKPEIQSSKVSDGEDIDVSSAEHVPAKDSTEQVLETLSKSDQEISSNVNDNIVFSEEQNPGVENETETLENAGEQAASKFIADEEKSPEVAEESQQHEELQSITILNHSKVPLDASIVKNDNFTSSITDIIETTKKNGDTADPHNETKTVEETATNNLKETENINTENDEQFTESDDKKQDITEMIVQGDATLTDAEDAPSADLEGIVESESSNIEVAADRKSTSETPSDCTEENLRQTDLEMPTENSNIIVDTTQHSENLIASNDVQFLTENESPKPTQQIDLNEFQITSFEEEKETREDSVQTIADVTVSTKDDLEASSSLDVKDDDINEALCNKQNESESQQSTEPSELFPQDLPEIESIVENITENQNEQLLDSVIEKMQSKTDEMLKEDSVLYPPLEELMEEGLNEIPNVVQSTSDYVECLTDVENCSNSVLEFVENQLIPSEQERDFEPDTKNVENQLITTAIEEEHTHETESNKQPVLFEKTLEVENSNDNIESEEVHVEANLAKQITECTESNETGDVKSSESADDSHLIMSQISEVNDGMISLELKVLQSLEESVEAICAISKEETANKEAADLFEESQNSETVKFRALDEVEILEVTSTVSANNALQKEEEPDGGLSVNIECFNSAQFVAETQSVEDCVELQINKVSLQDKEILPDSEDVDVASIEAQDGLLTDEILQKEIENLEEQNVVFPILEGANFDDAIETQQDVENVQQSDLTNLSEIDDQFEVNEACKYIEANHINADDVEETVVIEAMNLQLVEDERGSFVQNEEGNISIAKDNDEPKLEVEIEKNTIDESPNVIVEEVDDQTVNPDEGNAENLESVCIEEIPDSEVIPETKPEIKASDEPIVVMPEEQLPHEEVSSSLIIEIDPKSKSEELHRVTSDTDEHARHDSEYSSKMSSDQNLKMTITKHKVDDSLKSDSENTIDSGHSILKIFDSHESTDDKEKDTVPRLIIKPVVKPSTTVSVEEVEHSVPKITIKPIIERSEAQLSPKTMKASNRPESPKVTRSQKCDMLSPLKLTIKPVLKPDEAQQQKSSPKLTIKPILKMDDPVADSSVQSPKITIKPIIKPCDEDVVHSPKITIKPIVKPTEQECELVQSPRITIKPVVKPSEQEYSPEREHSPRITIKPIVKPPDDQKIAKQDARDSPESSHNPRITIKPLVKPEEAKTGKQDGLKKSEQEITSPDTSHSPRITIKPIVKPVDEQKQSKQETSMGSPKITIKPIIKPQESEEDTVHLIDFEEQIKQERIVLKINKNTKSTRKRQAVDATEKLAKIKVKYSRERGRAHIVSGQGKLKRALEGSLDPDFKRTKFEAGDLTITPINPTVQIEKIEEANDPPPEVTGSTTMVGIDDPLEKIPVFEITPESAAVMKTPLAAVQPLPPAPRKRGRPRKIPLVVREEFKDAVVKEEKVVEPPETPPVEESGRPKRSCRGPSVRTTLGIRTRRPRGSSRGRGRGRGSRGGGTRGGRQQRISAAKLKLLKEEAASAIAEETKRLDTEQKDVEMKEEVSENVDAGTNSELVIIEEETRMSADINSSRAQTPAKQVLTPAPGDVEDTQSSVQSTATTESVKVRKGTRLEVHQEPEGEVISADQLAEYYWGGGGPYMLQEQVAQFLGIKSFKRKYPGITRRPVDMQERDFIRESGLASEAMCDLGLTAVSSADILDIMYSDFQHKYEEYCKHQRDRQAKDFSNKQKALSLAASQEKTKQDIMQQAVQSAASWNASFNKARRDERKSCMDLQTFTVHYPKGKMKKIDQPKVGFYPVALVPGQYTDYYKTFTPTELNNLPLNTMLYEPINIHDEDSHSDGSSSESDSSSSSSGSSSSDSSGDDNCNVCSPASSTNKKAISTTN